MKVSLALAALLCCGPALAHEHDERGPGASFDQLDTDHNGVISRSEAEAGAPRLAQEFDAIDADKDGSLSKDEIRAHHSQMREHRFDPQKAFSTADADSDGRVSKDEAAKGMPMLSRHFDDIDANHDGYVTLDEMKQHMAQHRRHDHERPGAKEGGDPGNTGTPQT
jgi:Ca2+-binding EF-hand superfamily protein